jgi:hypothetical protein
MSAHAYDLSPPRNAGTQGERCVDRCTQPVEEYPSQHLLSSILKRLANDGRWTSTFQFAGIVVNQFQYQFQCLERGVQAGSGPSTTRGKLFFAYFFSQARLESHMSIGHAYPFRYAHTC